MVVFDTFTSVWFSQMFFTLMPQHGCYKKDHCRSVMVDAIAQLNVQVAQWHANLFIG